MRSRTFDTGGGGKRGRGRTEDVDCDVEMVADAAGGMLGIVEWQRERAAAQGPEVAAGWKVETELEASMRAAEKHLTTFSILESRGTSCAGSRDEEM